jgi:myo-inositol 2-dehydrogenase / D-chiro-inositol 1-dehydrogenase
MNEQPSHLIVPSHLSRRSFLKRTSTVAAGGAMLGSLAVERFAHGAGTDETLKIALIGCGGRGSGAAAQALATPNTKLVAMADVHEDRMSSAYNQLSSRFSDKVDVPKDKQFIGFDGYKQAIALADVAILATPPGFRPFHFEEAVKQGKHVFAEKPVAVDAPGVRRFLAAAEEAKKKNLKVGIGLQRHHHPGYQETIKRLQDGAVGQIILARAFWNDAGVWVKPRQASQNEMQYQVRNWYYFTWLSGDHIAEQHIHNLDVINWVKNAYPVRAKGMGGRQVRIGKDYGEIFDHHCVEFFYEDGTILHSECRHQPGCWSSVSEHVYGTKGKSEINRHQITGDNAWRYQAGQPVDPYQREHDVLFAAIRNNTPHNEAEFGAKSTMTAILGRMATYSGKEVEWTKALNSQIDLMPERFAWDAEPKPKFDKELGLYPCAIPGKTEAV